MTRELDRLETLADAALALAGELDLDAVLDRICSTAAALTGARYAALGVIGHDETISRFITHGVTDEQVERIGHYPTGKGILGVLIRDPQVLRLDELHEHPASYGFPPEHPPMTTFLGAPVRSGGTVYGNLYLTEKDGGFTLEDERLIVVLAAQAGAAVENALLSQQLRSLAVQDERDRISRELHDGVIQSLFSIGMGLESARNLVHTSPDRVTERLDDAVDAIDGAIRELRNQIFQLRPHQAAAMGLARGLTELARELEVNALVRPILDVDRAIDRHVPAEFVPDLLQVVREALSNVAKHADAQHVEISVRVAGGELGLEVADDGVGFEPGIPRVGRGLDNIRERADVLAATLEVDSTPGKGTAVRLHMSLNEE